jgi:outer membrane lipoprotein SlyB
MNRILKVVAGLAIAATLAACATSNSGSVYDRSETRRESTVRMGVIESVRAVSIEGTRSGIGGVAGGVAGGVGGSAVGGGGATSSAP